MTLEGEGSIHEDSEVAFQPVRERFDGASRPGSGVDEALGIRRGLVNFGSRDQGEGNRPDAPHVRSRVDLPRPPVGLLRRHVFGSPQHLSGDRGARSVEEACDAEVEHLELAAGGEKQVVRLDVAVDDSLPVRRREDVEHAIAHVDGLDHAKATAEPLPTGFHRLALEQIQDEKDRIFLVMIVVVDDANDVGVGDLIGHVPFAEKARPDVIEPGQRRVQHLERHPHPVAVCRFVDRGHPTEAEDPVEPVLAAQCRADARVDALNGFFVKRHANEPNEQNTTPLHTNLARLRLEWTIMILSVSPLPLYVSAFPAYGGRSSRPSVAPMRVDITESARARVGMSIAGKYQLVGLIGHGGMAAVYEAVHRNGLRVAIKMLHPHLSVDAGIRQRFLQEGKAANLVEHRGAVRVTDDDVAEDGSAFLVMDLLQGETLDARWERGGRRLPAREVCELAGQLLDVLAAAHAKAVVHRDIKPENLFLTTEGVLKVLDFGIARIRDPAGPHGPTQHGQMIGTPAFMPPEQALGRTKEIDGQTDLWAAGATMFTLTTGHYVHDAETMQEMLVHAASRPARAVTSLSREIPAGVAAVIDRALAFKKEDRWPDALAMHAALARAYSDAYAATLPSPRGRPAPAVDVYGATAAVSREAPEASLPAAEPPGRPPLPPTAQWVQPPAASPGVSTTAGVVQLADVRAEETRATRRRRSRAPMALGGALAVLMLGGGAAALVVLHRAAGVPNAASSFVAPPPPSPTAAPSAMSTSPTAAEVSRVSPPPQAAPAVEKAEGSESDQPRQRGLHPQGASPAPQPQKPRPGPLAQSPAPSPPPTPEAPPTPPIAAAPAPTPAPDPATPHAPPTPVSAPTPTCRYVQYFEPDGTKHFKQECR